jgi:cation transporter-like permease
MGPTWGRYLSRTTILTCILLFVAGVFVGVVTYLQRSDVAEQHVPGSNAVPAHVVLALVAVGLAILVSRLRLAR